MVIKDHPYTDPTQIEDFNFVAEQLNLKKLYVAVEDGSEEDPLQGVVMDEPPPHVEPTFNIADILRNAFTGIFSSLPHWGVNAEEVDLLSEAWGGAIDYWFPDMTEGLTPATNAYITTGLIFLPKINNITGNKQQTQTTNAGDPAKTQTFGDFKKDD